MTSTPSFASWWAIMSFSRLPRRVPAACSPSRSVVSNTATFSEAGFILEFSNRLQNAADFFRRNRQLLGHARDLSALTLPHSGDHQPGKFLAELLKRSIR